MVSAAKAFEKEPPRQPLTSLQAIVDDFQWRYVDRKKTDQVIKYCAEADSFQLAVQRAVESRDAQGKHHNHQSKVDITARRLFGRRIIRGAQAGQMALDDFDEFHDWLDAHKPHGIGPVTVYDVAVRVGAYLGIEPHSVYMHAGVRQGVKALFGAVERWLFSDVSMALAVPLTEFTDMNPNAYKWAKIPASDFPSPLGDLPADDIEDIMCTYREVFEDWNV